MASLPPPISVLSLSTVALIVVGLAILGFAIAQAAYGPDVLRSEEDWLERVHTFYLPRLCQLEEDIYTAQLQDWEATGQQLLSTRGKAEEIREHEDRRPTRQCMLTKVPSLINRSVNLVGLVQNQVQDSAFPWGTRQFREDMAAAKALVNELRSELESAQRWMASEAQKHDLHPPPTWFLAQWVQNDSWI